MTHKRLLNEPSIEDTAFFTTVEGMNRLGESTHYRFFVRIYKEKLTDATPVIIYRVLEFLRIGNSRWQGPRRFYQTSILEKAMWRVNQRVFEILQNQKKSVLTGKDWSRTLFADELM